MPAVMRCLFCGLLQDEPAGVKECQRCGGELGYENALAHPGGDSYIQVQMELDQVRGPAGRMFDRHLLVTLRTPDQVPAGHAAPTTSGRPPLSFVAVLDVSGSMHGQKIANAKEAVRHAAHRLHEGDSISLVIFANEARCVLEPTEVTPQTVRAVESALSAFGASGSTALCSGLELGIEKARQNRLATTLVLLLSDGQANVGELDLEKIGQRGFQARQESILVSSIGIGADYNEALMAEIATQGGGRFYHVLTADQILPYLTGELGEAANLAARQAAIVLEIPRGSVVMPFTAAYPVQVQDGKARIELGDVPGSLELEIPLRLTMPAQPAGTKSSIEGALVYNSPAGKLLSSALNRVTVRYVEAGQFTLRDGVVAPVVERVLVQIKAAQVLSFSRAAARGPAEASQVSMQGMQTVQDYASLLGEERAAKERQTSEELFTEMTFSPAQAKTFIASSFQVMRAAKKFTDKD